MSRGISRHDEVVKYLKDFCLYYDRMPTSKEAQNDMDIKRAVLQRILGRLVENGRLVVVPRPALPYRIVK